MFVPKLIIGGAVAMGIGIPVGLFLGEEKVALHSENSIYKRWVSPSNLILDCKDGEGHYQVFLDFDGGEAGKVSDVPSLKIVVLRDGREDVKEEKAGDEERGSNWRITNLAERDKGVYLEIPPKGQKEGGYQQGAEQTTCHVTNFEGINPQERKGVDGKNIKLSLSGDNCKQVEIGKKGKKDCSIDMSVDGNALRGRKGFKPQAHYRAIS